MFKAILLVGAGGFAGSIARYLLTRLTTTEWAGPFPTGTFIVNVLGCLAIGLIYGLGLKEMQYSALRLMLATGFCGGFTTFSSFSFEFLILLRQGHTGMAFLYAGGSMIVGLGAVWLGLFLIKGL